MALKLARLPQPITIVKGRKQEIPLHFYTTYDKTTGTGTYENLNDYNFICDFRYEPEDSAEIFTIEGPASPAEITLTNDGLVTLILNPDNTDLVEITTDRELNSFPFRPIVFELKAYNTDNEPFAIAMGVINVLQNVTRSDET